MSSVSRVTDREGKYQPWRYETPCGHTAWSRNHSRPPDHPYAVSCLTCKNTGRDAFRFPVPEFIDKMGGGLDG